MDYQTVAIVDTNAGGIVVWHVDVGVNPFGLSRMCGAWVLQPDGAGTLRTLTHRRYLITSGAGSDACRHLDADHHRGVLDLDAILAYIACEIDRLQSRFDEANAVAKSALVPPVRPRLPQAIDLERPPVEPVAPQETAVALGVARWLESVALAWESVEQQRLSKRYLCVDDDCQRGFPVRIRGLKPRMTTP
ncbi:MAG: hypothetical protein WBB07_18350 [Mycobacterium sp.]